MKFKRITFASIMWLQLLLCALPAHAADFCKAFDRELGGLINPYVRAGIGETKYLNEIRLGEQRLAQARQDGNLAEQQRQVIELVQLYEADNRPLEAAWTLMSFGPSEYANKLVEQIERQMSEAKVLSMKNLRAGMTETILVTLENGLMGVFKPKDSATNQWASNYRFEIAAYRFDKILGLNIVPVTVEVEIEGRLGSMQYFIRNADLGGQKSPELRLLDYLIANQDRNGGNFLTRIGGRIVAIDHGLTFTTLIHGPNTRFISSRRVFNQLKALSTERLEAEVKPYLVSADGSDSLYLKLKERVSKIIDEVENAIAKDGEQAVFRYQ